MADEIRSALERLQQEFNADILGLGEQLRRLQPDLMATLDWVEVFPSLVVEVEVRAAFRRVGITLGKTILPVQVDLCPRRKADIPNRHECLRKLSPEQCRYRGLLHWGHRHSCILRTPISLFTPPPSGQIYHLAQPPSSKCLPPRKRSATLTVNGGVLACASLHYKAARGETETPPCCLSRSCPHYALPMRSSALMSAINIYSPAGHAMPAKTAVYAWRTMKCNNSTPTSPRTR